MPELIAIETAPTTAPSKRAEYLEAQWRAARDATDHALYVAGILPRPSISPGDDRQGGVHGCRSHEWHAVFNLTSHLERRIRQLERAIRSVVASDHISDEQRRELLSGVYGKTAAQRRDASVLTEFEAQLVADYRGMDAAGKQMLRTLCGRLAESSEPDGGAQ